MNRSLYLLLSLSVLSISSVSLNKKEFWNKLARLAQRPGKMVTTSSLSDLPLLHAVFHEDGCWYNPWNYAGVTGILAASAVYGVTRPVVREKAKKLIQAIKKYMGVERYTQHDVQKKVENWDSN